MAKKPMSEGARKVLNYLKEAGANVSFSVKEVQTALGFEHPGSVTGSVTGLVRKGYAVWTKEEVTDEEGKTKEISKFYLTEDGLNFDPDAPVED
jgi:hypothetical protein